MNWDVFQLENGVTKCQPLVSRLGVCLGMPRLLSSTKPPRVQLSDLKANLLLWLVVSAPLKNISQLVVTIPNIWINKKCSKPPTSTVIWRLSMAFDAPIEIILKSSQSI